jgi:flagellar hook protein FlgE
LAFKIEKSITSQSNVLAGVKVTYNADGSFDKFKLSGPQTGGARTINQPSNATTPTVAVTATQSTVTGTATAQLNSLFETAGFSTGIAQTGTGAFDPANAVATSTANTAIDIYDGLGGTHLANLFMRKTGENLWEWHVTLNGSDLTGSTADGQFEEVASGLIKFTNEGKLDTETTTAGTGVFNFEPELVGGTPPAANQAIAFDFGSSIVTDTGTGDDGVQQFGLDGGSRFDIAVVTVDGVRNGQFDAISIDTKGDIRATFTNGDTQLIGRLALALFPAQTDLSSIGSNLYDETDLSGAPVIVSPDTVGAGRIIPESLESSNTDLSEEFVDLILAQQVFQANARIVTVSDEILESLIRI